MGTKSIKKRLEEERRKELRMRRSLFNRMERSDKYREFKARVALIGSTLTDELDKAIELWIDFKKSTQ